MLLRDFLRKVSVSSVFEGSMTPLEELASRFGVDFALNYQRTQALLNRPGQTFQNIGEVVSSELFEAIHGDPTNTRTAQFCDATGDFIKDCGNNKTCHCFPAKTIGKPLAIRCPTLSSKPMKTLGHMAGHAGWRYALPGHDRIIRSKRRGHGGIGLGDLISQAAPLSARQIIPRMPGRHLSN